MTSFLIILVYTCKFSKVSLVPRSLEEWTEKKFYP